MALRELDQPARGCRREARRRAHCTATAVLRVWVVELLLEDAHEAAPVGPVRRHRGLLGTAQRGDLLVTCRVVAPVAVRHALPARALAPHGTLDVEDLQHPLDPRGA